MSTFFKPFDPSTLSRERVVEFMEALISGDIVVCHCEERFRKYKLLCPRCYSYKYRDRHRVGPPDLLSRWDWEDRLMKKGRYDVRRSTTESTR